MDEVIGILCLILFYAIVGALSITAFGGGEWLMNQISKWKRRG